MLVSVISPVLNEEPNLSELIRRVSTTLSQCSGLTGWEYLLVDDASTDRSWDIIREHAAHDPNHLKGLRHARRLGQGAAQRSGFFHARGDVCVTLDADLQLFPEDLPAVVEPILANRADIVATRVPAGMRTLVSAIGNQFMRWVLNSPVSDASTKFMGLRAEYARGIRMVNNDQRYVIAIVMARGARRVVEIPIHHQERRAGVSKYSPWKKMVQGIPEMIAVRLRIRRGFYQTSVDPLEMAAAIREVTP